MNHIDSAEKEALRWDNSRSIYELIERLKKHDEEPCPVASPNWANLEMLLTGSSNRRDQAEQFVQAAAMLLKMGGGAEFLGTLARALPNVLAWSDDALFVKLSDELPGKLTPLWFDLTLQVKGADYLVARTLEMPYRVWSHTEKLLAKSGGSELFVEAVYRDLATGKGTAEHFFWLWKAPQSEPRRRYLSEVYMLFKALQRDVAGSYLKSRRALLKLLLDDEKFQRTLMRDGEIKVIRDLVRCIRHLPLLDASEKQSLLVKIVRHYPQAKCEVEDKSKPVLRVVNANISSTRSIEICRRELENLIQVQVPENIAALEHARSLGDLRENSEFKFAKERQALLNKRRHELEKRLADIRPVNFAHVKVDEVVVQGCSVTIGYETGVSEEFHILGRLDSRPEANMISSDSPMGEVLLGCKVGMDVEMPSGDEAKIIAIKPLPPEMLEWLNSQPE